MLRRLRQLVVVGAGLLLSTGCRTAFEEGGKHGLPPAPPGTTDFSDYEPNQSYEMTRPGVAERSMYKTTASQEGFDVEVRDFLVAPAYPAVPLALDGAAVLEVRQGSGKATVGERKVEVRPGTIFTVDEGNSLRLTAQGEPLVLRAWIVSPGNPRKKP